MNSTFQPFQVVEKELADYFELERQIEAEFSIPACLLPPLAWAEAYRRIEDQPFSLDYRPASEDEPAKGYEPLRQIYDDDHPFIIIMKPAQVGVSELAISRALHALDIGARYWKTSNDGLNVGYLFPTQDALYDFSKERISGLKDESDKLDKFFTDYDDVGFKKAGHSYLYLRGAWSTKALKSFKADLLIFDEFDEMVPRAVALAVKRIRHSQIKRQLYLSTPTFPGKGIHAYYLQSDQHEWEVHCSRCDSWNTLDFFRDVKVSGADYKQWKTWDEERIHRSPVTVACPSCQENLPDEDRFGKGRWVSRRPEITRIRGYHVPALCFPSVSLSELAVSAISTDPEQILEFFRSDLGIPYEPKGARITDAMLKQLSVELDNGRLPGGMTWTNVTMGVDVGSPRYWYRISGTDTDGKRYVLAMGFIVPEKGKNGYQKLSDLIKQWHVRQCVIDMGPEWNPCAEWAAKHPGVVLRGYYPTTATALKGRLFRLPHEEPEDADVAEKQAANTIQINRNMAMDAVYNSIAMATERWPASIHNDPEVISHMKAPSRVLVTDKDGNVEPRWVHTTPDDYYHACVYDQIALLSLPRPSFVGLMPYTGEDD
jgi:hypothetical protein